MPFLAWHLGFCPFCYLCPSYYMVPAKIVGSSQHHLACLARLFTSLPFWHRIGHRHPFLTLSCGYMQWLRPCLCFCWLLLLWLYGANGYPFCI